ncbi:MAG TPA: DUF2073 domain-containing protein [Candidatus Altiarchaeales archaeon]|nr:DUF2073 domain-containing protein [Candidatus Altiarchaeales archaeon]
MGIEIEFISSEMLDNKNENEKMRFILEKIKKNKILVIEESLSSLEETHLIEETMSQIDEKFSGIEVSTLKERTSRGIRDRLIRLLGGRTGGLTVIGPSRLIKKVKKEPQKILLLAEKKK